MAKQTNYRFWASIKWLFRIRKRCLPLRSTSRLYSTPQRAKQLPRICHQAPYGKGTETLVDTKVRRVGQLDAYRISLQKMTLFVILCRLASMTQPVRKLLQVLQTPTDSNYRVFAPSDLRGAVPGLGKGAFNAMMSRAQRAGLLQRVCRGVYLYPPDAKNDGRVLYHVAGKLRAMQFNYISLESALSDAGVISQIPINWITIMSSGRSNIVDCGRYGKIEFVHTDKRPNALKKSLVYDSDCQMWRAKLKLALSDMKAAKRNMDLVEHEPV